MTIEIALAQAALGRRVFPVDGKRPLVRWKSQASANPRHVRHWWRAWPNAGVGWALPEGVVVVDVDDPALFFSTELPLPPAPGQRTTRGFHLLYEASPDREVRQGPITGGDLKVGGKGYVKIYAADAFTRVFDVTTFGDEPS